MTTILRPPRAIAVSVSDSPDADRLGVSAGHIWDTLDELAIELLASGVDLAYGGDLRHRGFTEKFFELAGKYRRRGQTMIRMTNYLAWPVHIRMSVDELDETRTAVERVARLVLIGLDGCHMSLDKRRALPSREPNKDEWKTGLTGMREVMREETSARIVIGGQVENYKGKMPGIAEEVLLSLKARQPVFLVGGFGGCTRDLAESVGLVAPSNGLRSWPGRELFEIYAADALNNGLTGDENRTLASTPFIDKAVNLVMLGLYRLYRDDNRNISR